jgi:hypothetical protein
VEDTTFLGLFVLFLGVLSWTEMAMVTKNGKLYQVVIPSLCVNLVCWLIKLWVEISVKTFSRHTWHKNKANDRPMRVYMLVVVSMVIAHKWSSWSQVRFALTWPWTHGE